ncbi:homocysteine S-methyltransferase [Microbacterium sp. ABRD28]|uniref:homocysteine S-methyltransferase n=1 Tax=Microbacterium sp. ABRD28 TaxID=2268461 RepID=UPI000F55476C|nr:homocysteine S-methyltransferase [Microbacterium sp. ABRD28]AZC12745.1 homocysteine S-methyltransferase [Microbacterium sp. ABRD28]
MPTLAEALTRGIVVLDGGLGTLLEAHGHDLSSHLWTARLLRDDPGAVRRAHEAYFAAGARVAISGSYQVSYEGLAAVGLDRSEVDALLSRSVEIAREARAAAGLESGEAWVAASVGPYGAARADGSEYTGGYGMTVAELRAWHRPRLAALAAAGADVLAVETIPSLAEVEAISAELADLDVPAWVSVTIGDDGMLRTGESLAEAAGIAASLPRLVAVGLNCCDPRGVADALGVLGAATDAPLLVYPNSGEAWRADERRWSGAGRSLADDATAWRDAGASGIGGCCRVGPEEIRAIANALG